MKSPRKRQINLKKYITNLSSDELKQELTDLINRFSQVREYYHIRINPTEYQEILNEYKKRIKLEFFPEKGYGEGRPSVGKAPILQFLKVSSSRENLIDLMLYYVEQGIKYTLAYGDIDEAVKNADMCIQIPMGGVVESLNLGTSTGIILSFIGYQRLKFVYSRNKVRFKPKGMANLKMRSWKDFLSNRNS